MSVTNHFAFMQALMKVENGIKSGYREETDSWHPHPSPEGGTDTIGYGHKLLQRDIDNGDIYISGRVFTLWDVPDDYILALFVEDVKEYEGVAKDDWNNHRPGDAVSWTWLDDKYKCVLTNLAFNLGSLGSKWPKLFRAIADKDDSEVRKQMVTTYKRPDGVRVRLEKRAKMIADAIGLKQ